MMPQITQEVIGHDAPLVHRGCPRCSPSASSADTRKDRAR